MTGPGAHLRRLDCLNILTLSYAQNHYLHMVEKETDMTALKDFMQEEHVKVLEMECVSRIDSWTKSFRVLVTADDPKRTLDDDLWPVGVGCRLYFKKRRQTET